MLLPLLNRSLLKMKCQKFPIRLAFLMTTNRTQGQLVDYVGLDLQTDISAHGELYVALLQYISSQQIKALFKNDANMITKQCIF